LSSGHLLITYGTIKTSLWTLLLAFPWSGLLLFMFPGLRKKLAGLSKKIWSRMRSISCDGEPGSIHPAPIVEIEKE